MQNFVVLIFLDNLNKHLRRRFEDVMGADAALKLFRRVEFHYTPKHASWPKMAEIGILDRQCLGQRFPSRDILALQVAAWAEKAPDTTIIVLSNGLSLVRTPIASLGVILFSHLSVTLLVLSVLPKAFTMRKIYYRLRCRLTRTLFILMGLRIGHWHSEIVSLWTLSVENRFKKINSILESNKPLDSQGHPVTNIENIRISPVLEKDQLKRLTDLDPKSAKTYFQRHTAGSSGNPTRVVLNREELARMLAVRDYCFRHCGIKLGAREGRLWGRPQKKLQTSIKNLLLNRKTFYPVGIGAQQVVNELAKWQPEYIYGYSTLIMECASHVENNRIRFPNLTCIICTAEPILPAQKKYLTNVFGCPVFEEYGSSEFDIIAFECANHHLHFVNPWLFIETGSDGEALISDVSRMSQNLIRYKLGDILKIDTTKCSELGGHKIIESLKGRSFHRFGFINKSVKFHVVEFAKAIDIFQSKHALYFNFYITQKEYGSFILYCSFHNAFIDENLTSFLTQEILKTTGHKINIILGKWTEAKNNKHCYFIQEMEL